MENLVQKFQNINHYHFQAISKQSIQFTAKKHSDEIHHISKKNAILLSKASGFNVKTSFSLLNNQICHHRSFLFYDLLPPRFFSCVSFTEQNGILIVYVKNIDRKFPILAFTQVPFNLFWLTKEIFL